MAPSLTSYLSIAAGRAPAGEVFAVEEGFEAVFFKSCGVEESGKSGWEGEGSELALFLHPHSTRSKVVYPREIPVRAAG